MLGAGSKASDANKMVQHHPWRAVLVAASAMEVVTTREFEHRNKLRAVNRSRKIAAA